MLLWFQVYKVVIQQVYTLGFAHNKSSFHPSPRNTIIIHQLYSCALFLWLNHFVTGGLYFSLSFTCFVHPPTPFPSGSLFFCIYGSVFAFVCSSGWLVGFFDPKCKWNHLVIVFPFMILIVFEFWKFSFFIAMASSLQERDRKRELFHWAQRKCHGA